MRDDATFYEVLGVDPDASTDAIEAAYRRRVKEFHPDVSERSDARDHVERINRAREVLTDAAERAQYDRLGHEDYLAQKRCGRTPRADASADGGTGQWEREGEWAAADGRRTGAAGPTGETPPAAGDPSEPPPGLFALWEALAAFAVVGVAGVAVAVTTLVGDAVPLPNERLLLVGCWTVVAVFAGRFAAGSALALPDDVVRVQALPLALFVGAWYLNQVEGFDLLMWGLLAYGAFATLYRTAALAARGRRLRRSDRSFPLARWLLPPAALWFLGTVPAVLVVPVTALPIVGPDETIPPAIVEIGPALPVGNAVPGGAVTVALGAPVAVTVGYAVWRLVQSLR